MGKKLFFLGILILSLANSYAQKTARNAQVSLFSYEYTLSDVFSEQFKTLSNYFDINNKDAALASEAILARNVFEEIKQSLEKVYGLYVLPENSFQDDAKYDANGYPQILIQKAIREGNTKFFFKIITRFDFVPINELPKEIVDGQYPRISICIKIFNKFGYEPIQIMEASYYTNQPFSFTPEKLNGLAYTTLENEKDKPEVVSFKKIIKECTYRAVNR